MRRKILQYEPKLKHLARNLRNSGTPGEAILWNQLKSKKIKGYKFRRQVQIGNYIVDFFCPALMLVIEIDGSSHDEKEEQDILRQKELEKMGISFLRFTEGDIRNSLDGVVFYIEEWMDEFEKKKE